MKTIGVDLWAGQVRGLGANLPTMISRADKAPRRSVHDLFVGAYPKFAEACRSADEPGVALVAVDEITGQAAGLVRLCARVDRHVAAIVGRHDACDLFLARNERLALRHFAVVVDPVQNWRAGVSDVRFRIFDLRTSEGILDEEGRHLRGLRAEGPAVVRCGGYVIFALPLGDPTDWPASGKDAWACLPQRTYFDELDHCPDGSGVKMRVIPAHRTSVITRTHGPWDSAVQLATDGDVAGTLAVSGPAGHGRIEVGSRALTDGVLLGRYARCDGAGLGGDASLSRVHALLLLVDDRLLAIDTASRNGSRTLGGDNARVIALTGDTELELGCKTRVRWRWAS